jgi:hypothetical protein
MGLLYGRTGRLTTQNGGFRRGQLQGYGTNLVDLDVRAPQPPGPAQPAHPGRATLAAFPEVVQLAPFH